MLKVAYKISYTGVGSFTRGETRPADSIRNSDKAAPTVRMYEHNLYLRTVKD